NLEKLPATHERFTVAEKGEKAVTIRSKVPGGKLSIAVCNADNCIELLGGPRLTVELYAPLADGRALAEISAEALDHAVVLDNENPYVINVPGQWEHRPGINHAEARIDYAIDEVSLRDSLFRRWMPAGTYMATYTRLTTMEAANESGRHAVNAILQ